MALINGGNYNCARIFPNENNPSRPPRIANLPNIQSFRFLLYLKAFYDALVNKSINWPLILDLSNEILKGLK